MIAKKKQIIVFVVNIDSPSKNHVNIGKIINPADEPRNLAVHAEPVASTIILQEYQKATLVGIPKNIAAENGRSFHHSDRYCEFS